MVQQRRRSGWGFAKGLAVLLIASAGVLGVTAPAWAEPEPNDTPATATPLLVGVGGRADGLISPAGDVDVYAFAVTAPGTYVAQLLAVASSAGPLQLEVLNPAGATINGVGCTNALASGNICTQNQVTLAAAGTYFVRVQSPTGTTTGGYTVRVLPSRDLGLTWAANAEPNDLPALAPPIGVGRTAGLTQSIEPRDPAFVTVVDDVDVYTFQAAATGTYVAELYDVQAALGSMQLQVLNSAGGIINGVACFGVTTSGNVCARNEAPLTAGQTYYVKVLTGTAGTSGRYSLRVLPSFQNGLTWSTGSEPNDRLSISSPLTLGVTQGQAIDPVPAGIATFAPDIDVLRISAVAGRSITVTVSDLAGGLTSTGLLIRSAAGTIQVGVGSCNATGVVCNRLTLVPAATGILGLEVTTSNSGTGRYNICARLTTAAACRSNALRNPGLETDANADTRPDSWTSDARFTRSTAVAPHGGTFAGRLAATDNSTVTIAQTVGNQPFVIPYVLSGWVNIPATADTFTLALRVRWRNAANGTISVSTVRTFTAATAGWTRATATLTPPAGTNNAVVELAATSLGTPIYLDDLSWTATR